jgi:hypothetical protein
MFGVLLAIAYGMRRLRGADPRTAAVLERAVEGG